MITHDHGVIREDHGVIRENDPQKEGFKDHGVITRDHGVITYRDLDQDLSYFTGKFIPPYSPPWGDALFRKALLERGWVWKWQIPPQRRLSNLLPSRLLKPRERLLSAGEAFMGTRRGLTGLVGLLAR